MAAACCSPRSMKAASALRSGHAKGRRGPAPLNRVNGLALGPGWRTLRRAGRRAAARGVHAGRAAAGRRCAARRQVSQSAERPCRRPAAPHLVHRPDPPGDPVRPANLSAAAASVGAAARAQRAPGLDRRAHDLRHAWSPRAVLLSADETTLYVADGEARDGQAVRELRAYPMRDDGSLGRHDVLHTFGADHRGPQRGDRRHVPRCDGNIVACAGWRHSGPGPLIYVFAPNGAVIETHRFPADRPNSAASAARSRSAVRHQPAVGSCMRRRPSRRGLRKT